VDYITKPFQFEEVLARVKTHLTLRNMQTSLEAEIAERKRAEEALRWRNQELSLLNQMSQALQACRNEEETYQVVTSICKELFPLSSGYLFMLDNETKLNAVASWRSPSPEFQDICIDDLDLVYPDKTDVVTHPHVGNISLRIGYASEKERHRFSP